MMRDAKMKAHDLQTLRKEKGFSQRRLANAVGISRGRLRRLEDGEAESITYRELKGICSMLGVNLEEFFQKDAASDHKPVFRRSGEAAFRLEASSLGYQILSLLPRSEDLFVGKIFVLPQKKLFAKQGPCAKKIYITTLVGMFRIEVFGQSYELNMGDSLLFDGSASYSIENPTLRESVAFLVTIPGFIEPKDFTSSQVLSPLP